jgi:NADH-quinone oxidoreductase subunit J
MQIAFAIIAALTLVSAVAAMSLRNLVHCALCLAVALAGLAAFYLQLGAAFVGWAQILIYVGAVAILIVFAILLTRSGDPAPQPVISRSWMVGIFVALLVFGVLAKATLSSPVSRREPPPGPEAAQPAQPAFTTPKVQPTVREIGNQLMTRYVLPLEVMGLLLTVATIGAVLIAMQEGRRKSGEPKPKPRKEPAH